MVATTNTTTNMHAMMNFIEKSKRELSTLFPELQYNHYQVEIKSMTKPYRKESLRTCEFCVE